MIRYSNSSYCSKPQFFDDSNTSYVNEDNLYFNHTAYQEGKVSRAVDGLLGGKQEKAEGASSKNWLSIAWQEIKDGFNWIISKIVQIFRTIFGIKPSKSVSEKRDSVDDASSFKKALFRSESCSNLSKYKSEIIYRTNPSAIKEKISEHCRNNKSLKESQICLETVKGLIRDLKSETNALEKSVGSMNFDELKNTESSDVERKLDALQYLQILDFEISEGFRVIELIIHNNHHLINKGNPIPAEEIIELRNLQLQLNNIYHDFKEKVYRHSVEILTSFHFLTKELVSQKLEEKDLWFLRAFHSVLRFLDEHEKKLNSLFLKEKASSISYLGLDYNEEAFLKQSLDTKTLASLIEKVQLSIQKKQSIQSSKDCEIPLPSKDLFQKAAPKGFILRGIPNVCNSCYMNSDLQAILGTKLRDYLSKEIPKPQRPSKERGEEPKQFIGRLNTYLKIDLPDWKRAVKLQKAIKEFKEVYEESSRGESSLSLYDAAKKLRFAIFDARLVGALQMSRLYSQHDAPECMLALLMALNVKFKLMETTASIEDKGVKSVRVEDAHLLEIPIGGEKTSFQELIDQYGQVEEVNDPKNQWEKDDKKYSKYTRSLKISGKIPELIVVQLKRMDYDLVKMSKVKVHTEVTWASDEVDLANIIDPVLYEKGESTVYSVQAYVNHHGATPNFGHYTANVLENNQWFHLNDNDPVKPLTEYSEKAEREKGYLFVLQRKK